MSLVGELHDNQPTLSTLLNIISKSESVKQRLELMEVECQSLKQEQQMINNQVQFIMENLLHSNSMREGQVEAVKNSMMGEKRNLRLDFRNSLPQEIETGVDIKATDLNSIQVELVDDSGQVVNSGPEASANVELVALPGHDKRPHVNCTGEEFNNIISIRENNKQLLVGELQFNLNEGIGTVGKIKFKHGKDWIKQSEFILVARVVNKFTGVQIKEAKAGPFKIKDCRNGYYSKRDTLTLEDEIYRLKNVSYKGKIWPRLQKERIYTIKDFLHWLFKDPAELKQMIGLPPKKFEETVKHAQKGMINDRLCCYSDLDGNIMVVFNFVNQVLGVVLGGQYHPSQGLSYENKANAQKLAIHALQHWKDVEFVDDEASLLQKFPRALAFASSMISSVEEHDMQKINTSSTLTECNETLFDKSSDSLLNYSTGDNSMDVHSFQQLELMSTVLFSEDTVSPPENLSALTAYMEEYGREIKKEQDPTFEFHANDKQNSTTNKVPLRCSRPWVFMFSILIWKRATLKKNTSNKRDSPLPETSTDAKKQRMC